MTDAQEHRLRGITIDARLSRELREEAWRLLGAGDDFPAEQAPDHAAAAHIRACRAIVRDAGYPPSEREPGQEG